MKHLLLRLAFIPIPAFFAITLVTNFFRSIRNLVYFYFLDSYPGDVFSTFSRTFEILELTILIIWFASLVSFEIAARVWENLYRSRWLKHLRFGPVAVWAFFLVIIVGFDIGMVQYSKLRIKYYEFYSHTIEPPDFRPHVDYRGWCGNGYSARLSDLYLETAMSGLDSEKPDVRARSLLMVAAVDDFLNGSDREQILAVIAGGCSDSSTIVTEVAAKLAGHFRTDCRGLQSNNR